MTRRFLVSLIVLQILTQVFAAQAVEGRQTSVRGVPRQGAVASTPPVDKGTCKEQQDAVLAVFDREDPCAVSEERLREVAVEFRRIRAEVCRSGLDSIESTLAAVIRGARNKKCQKKVTGQAFPDWVPGPNKDVTLPSRMSPAVQDVLFGHATTGAAPQARASLEAQAGGVAVLTIKSARADLAALMRRVYARNGVRYAPIDEQTVDTVEIACGDQSERASFHCARLEVVAADGTPVAPVTFSDDPFIYKDRFDLQQAVRIFTGRYRTERLFQGFSVNYASTTAATHTLHVSAAEAANVLLLSAGR